MNAAPTTYQISELLKQVTEPIAGLRWYISCHSPVDPIEDDYEDHVTHYLHTNGRWYGYALARGDLSHGYYISREAAQKHLDDHLNTKDLK